MGTVKEAYATLRVRHEREICFVQMHRPEANNAINTRLIDDLTEVIDDCEQRATVLVLEGLPEVFCSGADFAETQTRWQTNDTSQQDDPKRLYHIWQRLSTASFISVAHVRGRANAGGIGFVAACDVVLSDEQASFSLSELLFGLLPACVMPFLIRRIGHAKANCLTLLTQPIAAPKACDWGLVDAYAADSENLLRKQLLRLRLLDKGGIRRYKCYSAELDDSLSRSMPKAIAANLEAFSDPKNIDNVSRYLSCGKFPWETS